jgi:hypothetical protein
VTNARNVTLRNMVIGDGTAAVGQAADTATSIGDDGVSLSSSSTVTIDNTLISRTAAHGVRGLNVNGLTILNSEVLNAGTAIDEDAVNLTELLGVSAITSSVFDGMHSQGLMVQNDTMSPERLPCSSRAPVRAISE